mgnify:CR=1 FL=1
MSKPVVAIVGRPNVGKSTLFNALAGEMISIVKDTPGVTRDRIYADVTWLDKSFTLIDTGGIEPDSGDIILSQMREQAQIAIDTADVIVFITDVQQGLVDSDAKVADMLRRSQKPVVLVVNKVDSVQKYMMDVYEFYNLGIGEPVAISAANRTGIGDMLDEIIKEFPEDLDAEEDDDIPKVAVVGKPNVGKSSLLNSILGENRAIVTDIAGTTRDVIEEFVNIKGIPLKIVDTAGIRETEDVVEKIGVEKSRESFSTADLVIMVLDASRKLSEEDMEILESLKNKKTIVLLNKMDLEPQIELEKIEEFVNSEDIIKISALKHQGIEELQDKIEAMVYHGSVKNSSNLMITNSRHKDALFKAYESINDAISAIEQRMPYDFIEVDFKNIWDYLGYINGDTVREDLLDTIFANFCIGK